MLFKVNEEMAFKRFAVKKLITTVITLFFVLGFTFFLFRILPGDPLRMMFQDPRIRREQMDLLRKQFGLDQPIWVQFALYLKELFNGNLGLSYSYKKPVTDVLLTRIPATLLIALPAIFISTFLGVALGAVAGWKRGKKTDSAILSFSLVTYAIPAFCMGLALLLVFSFVLGIFPIGGMTTPASEMSEFGRVLDILRHAFLPIVAMVFWYLGGYVLLTRNSMLDVLGQDYINTARAKGLKESSILIHHALRNALLPIVTLTGENLIWAAGGEIEIETIFSWPGVGRLVYDAVIKRDYPLLQGAFLLFGVIVILGNLLTDIAYAYIDPRVRVGR